MQNGRRKELDSRYQSLYSKKPSDDSKGKQLPGYITREVPDDRKAEYPLEYGKKK